MSGLFLLLGLLCGAVPAPEVPAETIAAYESGRAKAGRDAEAHYILALWCGERGMDAERSRHLSMAVQLDPKHARARERLGLPPAKGPAESPEVVAARAEYPARRARAPRTADGQWGLALWCEQKGLASEAAVHLAEVVRLDPNREGAWRRLGYRKFDGRWMTESQIRERGVQVEADREWGKRLKEIHKQIHGGRGQQEAEAALAAIREPRAVPAVFREFGSRRSAPDQRLAIQVLGQIESPAATRALATFAVAGATAEIRRGAAESLRGRDLGDFVSGLVALLVDPVRYEVRPVGGPGSPGVLMVEGERFNTRRFYAPPAPDPQLLTTQLGDRVDLDEFGMPVITRQVSLPPMTTFSGLGTSATPAQSGASAAGLRSVLDRAGLPNSQKTAGLLADGLGANSSPLPPGYAVVPTPYAQFSVSQVLAEARSAARAAQSQIEGDVAQIESFNAAVKSNNDGILTVLRATSGQNFDDNPREWRDWAAQREGRSSSASRSGNKPTVDELVPLAYRPSVSPRLVVLPVLTLVDS